MSWLVGRLRLLALFSCLLVGFAAAPGAFPARSQRSWAQPQIRVVVAHGLMAGTVAAFRPNDDLNRAELQDLVAEAAAFYQEAAAAGLHPPARFGTEVVARLLGLRTNHPTGQDDLERLPSDPAHRAEAAYSAAEILRMSEWETKGVTDAAASFEIPALTPWQRRVLTTAVGFIGFPYVWGGESERAESPFGLQARGGFDCSGFAWRVYKLQSYPGAPQLAATLRGRTAAAMAGEVPRRMRIRVNQLAPADLLFFGDGGRRARAAQIDHEAIYLGNGWLIQSSGYGVALAPVEGWYETRLAWGRRPLAEAGL